MKNLKKILLSMMVLFLAFAFIGCPAEPDPVPPVTPEPEPETPVVTNNFKGNVFVVEMSIGSYSEIWGYIEFIDDTNGKTGMVDYVEGEPIIIDQPFTYSVTDDKATITATMEGKESTVTTEKLTNDKFTFSTEGVDTVTGETYSVLMTCTKGDKSLFDVYTVCYGEETLDKDFFYELEYYAEVLDVEDDYNLDTANKKIVLTANGDKKCNGDWTIVIIENVVSEEENYIENIEKFNMLGLNKPTDYTIDIDSLTITVTESGMKKIEDAKWAVLDPDGNTVTTFLPFEEAELEYILLTFYERFGLENGDYIRDDAEKTITLTETGWEKVRWTVQYPEGTVVKTFASYDVARSFVSSIGLSEDTDYTVDDEARTITLLTEDSLNKVNAAWIVVAPDGTYLMTFPSLSAAGSFATENGLDDETDYTMDNGTKTITLTADGWEKLQDAMAGGSEEEWTVLDSEGNEVKTFGSLEEAQAYANEIGLSPEDYTVDEETHTITLN